MHSNLRSFIDLLSKEGELCRISAAVDPYLEIAEIHRRVISESGKALLFTKVKGSQFPVISNLFGTQKRIELAFGRRPEQFVRRAVEFAKKGIPPKPSVLWQFRDVLLDALRIGTRNSGSGPILESVQSPPDLESLPLLQLWPEDGGHFITLPLVFTQSPVDGKPNLGMYRIQRYDRERAGMHWQIGKGGGFHYFEAEQKGVPLPATVFLGGPPALIISAIAPLPEGIPEILLSSLIAGKRIRTVADPKDVSRVLFAEAEFAIVGNVPPFERRPEGPFGDHYGYYSLVHEYPVFYAERIYHRKDAIYPATVVGKPRQEDFFIGDYLQELLSPVFPLVMPAVLDLWSYGETGFHSLAAAVVREAVSAGFRILGEGQLTLTKFLLLTDSPRDLRDFRGLFEHILERVDWSRDFFIFGETSFDTLDYASGKINHGSKAMLLGLGDSVRELPRQFSGPLPAKIRSAEVFCGGCLVIDGPDYEEEPTLAKRIAAEKKFSEWQIVVIVSDAAAAAADEKRFLWETWTRFNPATDIAARQAEIINNHIAFKPPIVIDARTKPWYPAEVEPLDATVKLVNRRWAEYFE
ncbi:MAG: 4-hydroxybenzoate decarboxylase [Blastocatellia bacterium]